MLIYSLFEKTFFGVQKVYDRLCDIKLVSKLLLPQVVEWPKIGNRPGENSQEETPLLLIIADSFWITATEILCNEWRWLRWFSAF